MTAPRGRTSTLVPWSVPTYVQLQGADNVIPPQKLPTEFRVFAAGKVRTTKGDFLFDAKAAAAVMAEWKDYGNEIQIDLEHKSVDPDARAGDGKAAGWCKLAVRGGELWAVSVRWTASVAKQMVEGAWKYISPTFDFDRKSGRILALLNIALTNIPATKNLPPLVAASRGKRQHMATTKTKAQKRNETLGTKKTKKTVTETEEEVPSAATDEEDSDEEEMDEEESDSASEDEEESDEESDDEEDSDEDGDDDGDEDDDDDGPPSSKAPPPPPPKKKSTKAAQRVLAAAARAFGTTDPSELEGAFMAIPTLKDQVARLSKKVEDQGRATRKARVREMVEAAIRAKRLAPAARDHFVEIGLENPKRLKGLLATMPPLVADADTAHREGGSRSETLSGTERDIVRRTGAYELYATAKKEGRLMPLDRFLGQPGEDDLN